MLHSRYPRRRRELIKRGQRRCVFCFLLCFSPGEHMNYRLTPRTYRSVEDGGGVKAEGPLPAPANATPPLSSHVWHT